MNQKEQVKELTIQELLNQDSYIIPIYQRNYAWGDSEIEALLTDMVKAYERNTANYYVGSLVVYLRDDGQFEVIDGQQRLTTFTLIKSFFQNEKNLSGSLKANQLSPNRNISFEYRAESDKALDNLQQPENLPWNFKDAMQSIKRHWRTLVGNEKSTEIIEFILNKVQIIRTKVPQETDLNHYFEIMNTRGEQLEKHEVLKARFMSELKDEHFRTAFARIWDACSDMNRYVVMGFEPKIRKQIFGEEWQQIPSEDFEKIADFYKNNSNADTSKNTEKTAHTMASILSNGTAVQIKKNNEETSERFNSVIDFPNFLLHVLRIYLEYFKKDPNADYKVNLEIVSKINLDEKNLLESFDIEHFTDKDIKKFAFLLLQCRYLFDCYVIKSDTSKGDDDHWSLLKIQPQKNQASSYQYNNSFEDTDNKQQKIIMLLSMFHVSHPARIYKNWLYAVLRWLYQKKKSISARNYISFLERLSDHYYFGHYSDNKDFFDLITQGNSGVQSAPSEDLLNSGTNVPNFIFNRLDYLLWKSKKYREFSKDFSEKCKSFRFTFRSSVEHFYPQNPTNGENLTEGLHCFGNLCLISSSMNSKFSNRMPKDKVGIGKEQNLSLKLSLMMEITKTKNWDDNVIKEHGKEMLKLLNKEQE